MHEGFLPGSLDDLLGATPAQIDRYLVDPPLTFTDKYLALGLDPKCDFRDADLTDIDFSGADLRRFDFTGSDLRGAFGVGALWDNTTKLDNCDVDNSIFELDRRVREWIETDEDFARDLHSLKRQDEAAQFYIISTRLKVGFGAENYINNALKLAKTLFISANGQVARNNMLYCIRAFSKDDAEARAFVLHLISGSEPDLEVMKSAVTIIAKTFAWSRAIQQTLLRHLTNSKADIRAEVARCLLARAPMSDIKKEILPLLVRDADRPVRVVTGELLAARLGMLEYLPRTRHRDFDFLEGVTWDSIKDLWSSRSFGFKHQDANTARVFHIDHTRKVAFLLRRFNQLGLTVDLIDPSEGTRSLRQFIRCQSADLDLPADTYGRLRG